MSFRASRPTVLLGLALGAAAYFTYASRLNLEYIDEGQIVYPSWAVAEGAIPYRDFHHLYGPALFFLNGALLRLGADLMSIRLFLVVVKAAVGVAVFLLARSVAGLPYALLVWAWFVVTWGTPLVFNVPYGNHYAQALGLFGMLAFLWWRTRFVLACTLAGLCFGAALTFKQTAGVFQIVSFLLFLLVRPAWQSAASTTELSAGTHLERLPSWLVRLVAVAVPVFALALFIVYLRPHDTPANFLVIVTPAALLAFAAMAWALFCDPAAQRRAVLGLWCAGLGAAVVPLAFAAYYAAHGALPDLLFDTLFGLPKVVRWFIPLRLPDWSTSLVIVALVACFAALSARRRFAALVLAGTAAAAGALFLQDASTGRGLAAYFRTRAWYGDLVRLWLTLPFLVVALTAARLMTRRRRSLATQAPVPANAAQRREALLLIECHAAVNLLCLYPAGDVWHAVMILPSYLPLVAHLAERHVAAAGRHAFGGVGASFASQALIVGTVALFAVPSMQLLFDSRHVGSAGRLRRATRVAGGEPAFSEVARLIADLEQRSPRTRRMLVTTGQQMFYFLAGRRSLAEHDEFVLYLVAMNTISDDDAHRLVDEASLVERLWTEKPLVVDRAPLSGRFRSVFARAAETIDSQYRVAAAIGPYRVLEWKQ